MSFRKKGGKNAEMSFLEHLEELRWHLMRSVVAIIIAFVVIFVNKTFMFDSVVFAPKNLDFYTYVLMCNLSNSAGWGDLLCLSAIQFSVVNIEMAGQFLLHLKVSLVFGLVLSFPYVFWEFWRFISPGLHDKEKRHARGIVFYASFLFFVGVAFGYFVLAPFSLNFLGSYRVSDEIINTISLSSYTSLLLMMVLLSGVIFELPVAVYLLSKIGLVTPQLMRAYRKHALVAILILSAIITPPDMVSQILIGVPLYILYELSIFISARTYKEVV